MIAIVDYNAGNLKSVEKAMLYLGQKVLVTSRPEEILSADKVILPGVGAFGDAMKNLTAAGLDTVLREVADRKKPLLGICLGMQLLFEESEESPGVKGLGLLPGLILRIPAAPGLKIPHMGWNNLKINSGKSLYRSVPDSSYGRAGTISASAARETTAPNLTSTRPAGSRTASAAAPGAWT